MAIHGFRSGNNMLFFLAHLGRNNLCRATLLFSLEIQRLGRCDLAVENDGIGNRLLDP